jgi:hypothetical protein
LSMVAENHWYIWYKMIWSNIFHFSCKTLQQIHCKMNIEESSSLCRCEWCETLSFLTDARLGRNSKDFNAEPTVPLLPSWKCWWTRGRWTGLWLLYDFVRSRRNRAIWTH